MIKYLIFICLLFAPDMVIGQSDPLLNLGDNPANVSALNEQLRRTARRLNELEGGININTKTTGILTIDRGGTGQDFSAAVKNDIFYASATGVMGRIGIGTTGYFLKSTGASTVPIWDIPYPVSAVGSYAANSNGIIGGWTCDTSRTIASGTTSYTKIKEIIIPRSGALRIAFDYSISSNQAFAKIYRNGVAVGTERLIDGTSGLATGTYTEDISGWTSGDLVQLYGKSDGSGGANGSISNFRITEAIPPQYQTTYDQNI